MTTCCNCHITLDGVTEWPTTIDGEAFCAPCFYYLRAPMEPARFDTRYMEPRTCERCGIHTADIGTGKCPACKGKLSRLVLPPRG